MLMRGDWHDGYAPTDQERDPSDAPRGAGAGDSHRSWARGSR